MTETDEAIKNLGEISFGSLIKVKQARDTESIKDRDKYKDAALKNARLEEEARSLRLKNVGIEQDHADQKANREMRFKYSTWVFRYLVGYSAFVALLLILSGFAICGFKLEPTVLNFLVGSTAASAIGLVAAVTTGLFGKK